MSKSDAAYFFKLYGPRRPRTAYYAKDFLDYVVMLLLGVLAVGLAYGFRHGMTIAWLALGSFALATFIVRHGIEIRVPLIARRPQDMLYMFVYKLQNLTPLWFFGVGLLLLENALIATTPNLPHEVEWMRSVALWLFYAHFVGITVFRTAILIEHLKKKELVREVLMQTPWNKVIHDKTNITLEILHAYVTGMLAHIILLAPWYFVLTHARFSMIFLPVVSAINFFVAVKWMKTINRWFYRDHWLGHNSEFEFIYLHGGHHDAIPSALIAVGENGFLEGFLRGVIGAPVPFYSPIMAFLMNTNEVANDMHTHQYIPGIFPRLPRQFVDIAQHSTHHFGKLVPYSFGLKLDRPDVSERYKKAMRRLTYEFANSAVMDEELAGFRWDNASHRNFLRLHEKYQPRAADSKAAESPS